MKSLLLIFLLPLFALVLIGADLAEKPAIMPRELRLTNGAVLTNVQVVRWEKDQVVIRYVGGVAPVRYSNIAEPDRSIVESVRKQLEQDLRDLPPSLSKLRVISGQVFVTTQGAGAYKFAGSFVTAYELDDLQAAIERQRSYLPLNYRRLDPADKDLAAIAAWDKALEPLKPVGITKTTQTENSSCNLKRTPPYSYIATLRDWPAEHGNGIFGSYRQRKTKS